MSETAPQKILIVDDAPINRKVLGELLKNEHMVIMAKSGEQGLEKAIQHIPDLILLDVMMPDMDGYEVLQRLKANPATMGIAVIFITGLDRPEDEARGLEMGASDYITKPFHATVVRARVALHLRLARQHRLLESLANIDALTEIPNRRQFDQTFIYECRRCARAACSLSIALLDVDFFKQYNDHYGHAMGDKALQGVASVLRYGLGRGGDMGARYGGEEFVVIMPDTDHIGAVAVAEKLRHDIELLALPHEKSSVAGVITVSIGVATVSGEQLACPEDILKLADERLYLAKASGRNKVIGG